MEAASGEGEKKKRERKKRPGASSSKEIPKTSLEAKASAPKPGAVAEEVPVRYEGCGPFRRAVVDAPLSDAKRETRDVLFALFFVAWAIGDLVIAIIGFKTGAPQALIYGACATRRPCGAPRFCARSPRSAHALLGCTLRGAGLDYAGGVCGRNNPVRYCGPERPKAAMQRGA